jgi:hypothetical protein
MISIPEGSWRLSLSINKYALGRNVAALKAAARFISARATRQNSTVHCVFRCALQPPHMDVCGKSRERGITSSRELGEPSLHISSICACSIHVSVAGFGVRGPVGPRTGSSSGTLPGNSSGRGDSPGSSTGAGMSGSGLPGGASGGGSVGWPGVAGGISGGSIGIVGFR